MHMHNLRQHPLDVSQLKLHNIDVVASQHT